MKRAAEKLHSRRGASLIYALLLFLVASMVSVLILNASVTAIKRLSDDREREQEYLLLSSAARLLKKSVEESVVTITTTETRKGLDGDVTRSYAYSANKAGVATVLKGLVERLHKGESGPIAGSVSVELGNAGDDGFDALSKDVVMAFSMNDKREESSQSDYPISGSIRFADGGEDRAIYLSACVYDLTTTATGWEVSWEETDEDGNVIAVWWERKITQKLQWNVTFAIDEASIGRIK